MVWFLLSHNHCIYLQSDFFQNELWCFLVNQSTRKSINFCLVVERLRVGCFRPYHKGTLVSTMGVNDNRRVRVRNKNHRLHWAREFSQSIASQGSCRNDCDGILRNFSDFFSRMTSPGDDWSPTCYHLRKPSLSTARAPPAGTRVASADLKWPSPNRRISSLKPTVLVSASPAELIYQFQSR